MTPPKKKTEPDQVDEKDAKAKKKVRPTKPDQMSDDLVEFITAIDDYKRLNQRPFPSWGEVFEVLKALGYERPSY
jgi:hypothetical protein